MNYPIRQFLLQSIGTIATLLFLFAPALTYGEGVSIDDFSFSTLSADHITTGTMGLGEPVTITWKTTSASTCESYAQIQKGGQWVSSITNGWTSKNRETQTPSDSFQVTPKETTRYYLKCSNASDQTSVEKWIEVHVGAPTVSPQPGIGRVTGLRGTYYDTFSDPITRDERGGDIVLVRTDQRISFNWKNQSPSPLFSSDTFTVEWTGDLTPRTTGSYSFAITTDDAGALWINDELLTSSGQDATSNKNGVHELTTTKKIYLEVGKTYHIRMKTRNKRGGAVAQLWWIDPNSKKEVIPSAFLTAEALPRALPVDKGNGVSVSYAQYMHFDAVQTLRLSRTQPTFTLDLPSQFQNRGDFRFDTTWDAQLKPRTSTFYRFYTQADGPIDFSIDSNDQNVSISSTSEGSEEHKTESIYLEAGKTYAIHMAYRQSTGIAHARLLWSNALTQTKELVPQSQLFSKVIQEKTPRAQGQGLEGIYFNGENFDQLSFRRLDKTINFKWGRSSPKPGIIRSAHYSVRWEGMLEAPSSDFYQFATHVDDRMHIWIGDQLILDTSNIRAGQTLYSLPILLEKGKMYPVKIEYAQYIDTSYVNLLWASTNGKYELVPFRFLYPVLVPHTTGTGLRGDYYEGENFETFKARHAAEYIGYNWGTDAPDPSVPSQHFSVRWTGWVEPQTTDSYTLTTHVDDGVRLWVSEKDQNSIPPGAVPLINEWHHVDQVASYRVQKKLEAGHRYFIKMEFMQTDGPSQAQLLWSRKGAPQQEVIPRSVLYPEPIPLTSSASSSAGGDGNGLRAEYYNGENFSDYILPRIDPVINFDWGTGPPDPSVPSQHFSVRWTGWIQPRFSELYSLFIHVDDGTRLWISEKDQSGISSTTPPLIDEWHHVNQATTYSTQKQLEAGHRYFIKVEMYQTDGPSQIQMLWSSEHQQKEVIPQGQLFSAPEPPAEQPGSGTGLLGRYFRNKDIINQHQMPIPVIQRVDPQINFLWGDLEPYYELPNYNYSMRWEGFLQPQHDGDTTFYLLAGGGGGARLYVNEFSVQDNSTPLIDTTGKPLGEQSAVKNLIRGRLYYVRLDYYLDKGDSRVRLSWSHPQMHKQVIPQSQLYVPSTTIVIPR